MFIPKTDHYRLRIAVLLCIGGLIPGVVAGCRMHRGEEKGEKTISQRVEQYGPAAHSRLLPDFQKVGVAYPPGSVAFVGLKTERIFEVWVGDNASSLKLLKRYPILGASGVLGPKLKKGDRQVPEGLYRVELLNPNSKYHLALRVNYPNEADQARGKAEGRQELGGDIMIHGGNKSAGCLAMGDEAAEDLFVLAADTGIENIRIILSPVDFRVRDLPTSMPAVPAWTGEVYDSIRKELRQVVETK